MLSDERKKRNQENLGATLKAARERMGYTQKALAKELGLEYYTMISQMELGYISIPSALWLPIAQTLQLDPSEWVLRCLTEYQPEVYRALFRNRSRREAQRTLELLHLGQLDELLSTKSKS